MLKQAEEDTASGDITIIPEIPRKFTRILQKVLREALAQGYWLQHLYLQEIRGKKYRGRITLADIPADEELRGILSSENWDKVIPRDAVEWLDSYTPKLTGVYSNAVLEKTRKVIRNSIIEGATLQERIKALHKSSAELSSMSKSRIEAIARTEITRADTMGRLISMKANDDVIGVEFSAVMDDRTTDICASRHGLFMRLDDPRLSENTPPMHVNCRSLLLPLTVYEYPDGLLTSHEFDEMPSGMQRSEDIEEIRKILNNDEITAPATGDAVFDIEGLQEMAEQGVMPREVLGTREEQAEIYREINRLYERPAGNIGTGIQDIGNGIEIVADGFLFQRMFPSGKDADTQEREGLIKYMLHVILGLLKDMSE